MKKVHSPFYFPINLSILPFTYQLQVYYKNLENHEKPKMNLFKITIVFVIIANSLTLSGQEKLSNDKRTLKESFKDHFLIGTAMNQQQIAGIDTTAIKIITTQFNSIVAENAMKSMYLQPKEGQFIFDQSDRFVDFGIKNDLKIIGHTLIWHSQAPDWFFKDSLGNDIGREALISRMEKHIKTVVGRYRGKIYGWDVVNEAFNDDGTWRRSKFFEIIGEEFFSLAFKFAHEADPEAQLYYNDYNTALTAKRDGIAEKILKLKKMGLRIDGIGMQQHNSLTFPSIEEIEKSINKFFGLGLKVMITELEVSVLPWADSGPTAEITSTEAYRKKLDPYKDGLPDEINKELGDRYLSLFNLYLKHKEKIGRVTLWGVSDKDSWLNNFPIKGRKNYPLFFDRDYMPKSFVKDIIVLSDKFREN